MKCQKCNAYYTKTVDSRERDEGRTVYRRRRCPFCGYRFTTFEITAAEKAKMERTITEQDQLVNGLIKTIKHMEPKP